MHQHKAIAGIIVSFLILCSFLIIYYGEKGNASGNIIWVDDDQRYPNDADGSLSNPYQKIQHAIDAANDGDIIKVHKGKYSQDLVIDKSVTITSDNLDHTIILGNEENAHMIKITASSVSLEMFRIQDYTETSHRKNVIYIAPDVKDVVIIDNRFDCSDYGRPIYIDGANDIVIKNNTILNLTRGILTNEANGNSIYGNNIGYSLDQAGKYMEPAAIYLISSNNNEIENNVFRNSIIGLYALDSSGNYIYTNDIFANSNKGILINGGTNNTIYNNTVNESGNAGIYVSSTCIIKDNYIHDSNIGIILEGTNCIVKNNTIANSSVYGLQATSFSSGNVIYNNTFEISAGSSKGYHAKEEGNNEWDNGIVGNYWDDFYGPNPNSLNSTIGAGSSLFIYKLGGVYDRYPIGRFKEPPQIAGEDPFHLATGIPIHPDVGIKISDPDPDPHKQRVTVYFYNVLDNKSYPIDTAYNIESGKWANVTLNPVYTYIRSGYDYICEWYAIVQNEYMESITPTYIFTTQSVPLDNEPPTVNSGGQYNPQYKKKVYGGQVGEKIQFDGSGCADTDGYIQFYRWSFGDKVSVTNVVSPTHIYQNPGTYTASIVVIDDDGSSATESVDVIVEGQTNDEPTADAGGPYAGIVEELIYFSSTGSSDPDLQLTGYEEVLSYYWDFGDGSNSTEANPYHNYTQANNYTVTLTVTDKAGLSDVHVTNALIKTGEDESPGFEMFAVIVAMFLIFIFEKKRRNDK